jgi:hypothetical protein
MKRGLAAPQVHSAFGISGAKGRDKRPGLDTMLTDASRRKFDVVMSWAIDRLGRSLIDLLGTIQHLEACAGSTCTWISKRSTPRHRRLRSCSKSRARSPSSSAR